MDAVFTKKYSISDYLFPLTLRKNNFDRFMLEYKSIYNDINKYLKIDDINLDDINYYNINKYIDRLEDSFNLLKDSNTYGYDVINIGLFKKYINKINSNDIDYLMDFEAFYNNAYIDKKYFYKKNKLLRFEVIDNKLFIYDSNSTSGNRYEVSSIFNMKSNIVLDGIRDVFDGISDRQIELLLVNDSLLKSMNLICDDYVIDVIRDDNIYEYSLLQVSKRCFDILDDKYSAFSSNSINRDIEFDSYNRYLNSKNVLFKRLYYFSGNEIFNNYNNVKCSDINWDYISTYFLYNEIKLSNDDYENLASINNIEIDDLDSFIKYNKFIRNSLAHNSYYAIDNKAYIFSDEFNMSDLVDFEYIYDLMNIMAYHKTNNILLPACYGEGYVKVCNKDDLRKYLDSATLITRLNNEFYMNSIDDYDSLDRHFYIYNLFNKLLNDDRKTFDFALLKDKVDIDYVINELDDSFYKMDAVKQKEYINSVVRNYVSSIDISVGTIPELLELDREEDIKNILLKNKNKYEISEYVISNFMTYLNINLVYADAGNNNYELYRKMSNLDIGSDVMGAKDYWRSCSHSLDNSMKSIVSKKQVDSLLNSGNSRAKEVACNMIASSYKNLMNNIDIINEKTDNKNKAYDYYHLIDRINDGYSMEDIICDCNENSIDGDLIRLDNCILEHLRNAMAHGRVYFNGGFDVNNILDNELHFYDEEDGNKTFEGNISLYNIISVIESDSFQEGVKNSLISRDKNNFKHIDNIEKNIVFDKVLVKRK